jgi:hypothetical protein
MYYNIITFGRKIEAKSGDDVLRGSMFSPEETMYELNATWKSSSLIESVSTEQNIFSKQLFIFISLSSFFVENYFRKMFFHTNKTEQFEL